MSKQEISQSADSNESCVSNYLEEMHQLRARLAQSESYYQKHLKFLELKLDQSQSELKELVNSRGWRLWMGATLPIRFTRLLFSRIGEIRRNPMRTKDILVEVLREISDTRWSYTERYQWQPSTESSIILDPEYLAWINNYSNFKSDAIEISQKLLNYSNKPYFTIILILDDEQANDLSSTIDTLLDQSYGQWQVWLLGLNACNDIVADQVKRDSRINYMMLSNHDEYAGVFNEILMSPKSDFITVIHQGDRLAPSSLAFTALEIVENQHAKLIYSDEDKIDKHGNRYDHYLKPDYNPDLLLGEDYISRNGWAKCDILRALGGYHEGLGCALHYDALLRICSISSVNEIRHIDRIIFHAGSFSVRSAEKAVAGRMVAVSKCLTDSGHNVEVVESKLYEGGIRVRFLLPEKPPLVSIIIPTRNGLTLLRQCLDSIYEKTNYSPYEIIIVDNNTDDENTIQYLQSLSGEENINVLSYPGEFNYSAINNFAVQHARGEVLAFLNNDIEVIEPDWLDEMVSLALRDNTGAVGAMLWYPDDRIQHAGVVLGVRGLAGHAMRFLSKGYGGYHGRAVMLQNYSAVTAACLVVRKKIFDDINGFDQENLAVAFNDVDFCLRLLEKGYRNVWTPYAELYHHESASRGGEDTPEKQQRFLAELAYMRREWSAYIQHDPAYNESLTRATENFDLAWK
jgi:GT2 family glycosyltransferase